MKKLGLKRWRWLLALLLGVGTWWVVGWFLEPIQVRVLSYPEHKRLELPGPKGFTLGFFVELDEEDTLRINRANYPNEGLITQEQFDLHSNLQPRSKTYSPDEYVARPDHSDTALGSYLLDHGGASSFSQRIFDGFSYLLTIPSSRQEVRMRYYSLGRIDQYLRRVPIFGDWLYRSTVGIWDDDLDKFVWSVPAYTDFISDKNTCVLSNQRAAYVVVIQSLGTGHEIYILKVPLSCASPWWARTAGVLAVVLSWCVLRRRTVNSPT